MCEDNEERLTPRQVTKLASICTGMAIAAVKKNRKDIGDEDCQSRITAAIVGELMDYYLEEADSKTIDDLEEYFDSLKKKSKKN